MHNYYFIGGPRSGDYTNIKLPKFNVPIFETLKSFSNVKENLIPLNYPKFFIYTGVYLPCSQNNNQYYYVPENYVSYDGKLNNNFYCELNRILWDHYINKVDRLYV